MNGLMQDFPLTIPHIFWRAEKLFAEKQIVSKMPDGLHRYTYAEFAERVRKLAAALLTIGVKPGDRVATLAWNHYRHHELYYAVPCIGAVLHTLNVRLHPDQLSYIVGHAEDSLLFCDPSLQALVDELSIKPTAIELGSRYEELIDAASPLMQWPYLDEHAASGMCYTTGTTGDPRGVVYSHRSTVLHAFGVNTGSAHGLREDDITLTIVPMFHAMAWGYPYAAMMAGCKQVHPGADLDAASLLSLIESERVTICAGVPTIWVGMLEELERRSYDLSSVRCLVSGGAPLAPAIMRAFELRGVSMVQGWGMTETSPVCAHGHMKSALYDAPEEERFAARSKTGFMIPGVEFRVVDDDGHEVVWDGATFGELQVKGPWVASSYYKDELSEESFVDGWLKTGDVVTVDDRGYFMIVDRIKDLVRSGGEWISSVEVEKVIMGHPLVLEAAVIGIPHPKWTERPLACVVTRMGAELSKEDIIDHLKDKVSSWWLPDEVVFIDEIPKTSVGKFDKRALRARFVQA